LQNKAEHFELEHNRCCCGIDLHLKHSNADIPSFSNFLIIVDFRYADNFT